MEENKQHVQVPTMNLSEEGLLHTDPYVYACIKKFMNQHTKKAFPSNRTLQKLCGLSNKTIVESTKRLEAAGYITIEREFGKSNVYTFNDFKKFEICSFDLLDRTDLTPREKAYFIATQPYMFKSDTEGHVTFTSEQLAGCIGLSLSTLKRYEKDMQQKNLLQMVPLKKDHYTGIAVYERIYDFETWSNIIALKFKEQDEKINVHDQEIKTLKQQIAFLTKELAKVTKTEDAQVVV